MKSINYNNIKLMEKPVLYVNCGNSEYDCYKASVYTEHNNKRSKPFLLVWKIKKGTSYDKIDWSTPYAKETSSCVTL